MNFAARAERNQPNPTSEGRRYRMKRRTLIGWAIFALLALMIASRIPIVLSQASFLRGQQHLDDGRAEAAVAAFRRAIRLRPDFARAHVDLGSAYLRLRRYTEAEAAFRQAAALQSESCSFCGLGETYYRTNHHAEAEQAFAQAIKLNPADNCAYKWSGRMYYEQERYPQAVEAITRELRLVPNATSYQYLGNAYAATKHFDKALAAYQEAVRLDPRYAEASYALGIAHLALGDRRAVIKECERLRSLDTRLAARLSNLLKRKRDKE